MIEVCDVCPLNTITAFEVFLDERPRIEKNWINLSLSIA